MRGCGFIIRTGLRRVGLIAAIGIVVAIAAGSAQATVFTPAPAGTFVSVGKTLCTGTQSGHYAEVDTGSVTVGRVPAYSGFNQWVRMDTAVESSNDGVHWSQPLWGGWEYGVPGPSLNGEAFYPQQMGLYWRTLTYIEWYAGPNYSFTYSTRIGTYYYQDDDPWYLTSSSAYLVRTQAGYSCYII